MKVEERLLQETVHESTRCSGMTLSDHVPAARLQPTASLNGSLLYNIHWPLAPPFCLRQLARGGCAAIFPLFQQVNDLRTDVIYKCMAFVLE